MLAARANRHSPHERRPFGQVGPRKPRRIYCLRSHGCGYVPGNQPDRNAAAHAAKHFHHRLLGKWLTSLLVLVVASVIAPTAGAQDLEGQNATAIEAYRAGDYATAEANWKAALTNELSSEDRGRLLYNIGNAVYRQGRVTESIAWYSSCIRTTPRDGFAWSNLEFARREKEMPAADRGDLRSTVARILSAVDRSEAGWMMLLCIALWSLALVMEAVRGGSLWRRLSFLGFIAVLISSAPLAWQLSVEKEFPVAMVIEQPAAALRTEPGEEHSAVAQAGAGTRVQLLDELGDWVRIQTDQDERGWTPSSSVFELR